MLVVAGILPATAAAATNPALAGAVTNASSPPNLSSTTSVAVSGHYAYTTAYQAGELTAVDIANPAAPVVSGTSGPTNDLYGGSNVTIAGGYAFVVSKNRNASPSSNDDGTGNSLTILDVHTNPAVPAIVGTVRDPNTLFGAYGIAVSGSYAFVAYQGLLSGQPSTPDTSRGGFTVISLADLSHPSIVANIDNGSLPAPWTGKDIFDHPTSVAISGHDAYITSLNQARLTTVDISNPASPVIVNSLQDNMNLFSAVDVAVQGNHAYVADQAGGSAPELTVVDVTNPAAAKVVGALSSSALNGAYRIKVRGDFAYVSARGAGTVAAVDITNPASPRLAGFVFDAQHLNKTTGIDLDSTGAYAVATSPYLPSESNQIYPPFTTNTGTVSLINLDPSPIAITLAQSGRPPALTTQTTAGFAFAASDAVSAIQCSLDGAAAGPCTSPGTQAYAGLHTGTHTFVVTATGSNGATSSASYSWTVGAAPAVSSAPSISGHATQGVRLAAGGSFSGVPSPSVHRQWQRCNARGQGCSSIKGATGSSYQLAAVDVGHRIRVAVMAANAIATASATSSPTAVVLPAERIIATVSGAAARRPHLRLALATNPGSQAFTKVTISLGPGLGFAAVAALRRHLSVVDRHGHRLKYTVTLHAGAVTVALRKSQTAATVLVSVGGVTESPGLATRVRRHHRVRETAHVNVRDFKGQLARMAAALSIT